MECPACGMAFNRDDPFILTATIIEMEGSFEYPVCFHAWCALDAALERAKKSGVGFEGTEVIAPPSPYDPKVSA